MHDSDSGKTDETPTRQEILSELLRCRRILRSGKLADRYERLVGPEREYIKEFIIADSLPDAWPVAAEAYRMRKVVLISQQETLRLMVVMSACADLIEAMSDGQTE